MKLAIFNLEDKQYAIGINQISEVIRFTEITPVCDVSDFIEGIINLRDTIIPIINLKKRFRYKSELSSESNRIVIVKTGEQFAGIIVDSIKGVIVFDHNNISAPDPLLKESEYLVGIGKQDGKIILILDINKLIRQDQLDKAVI